MEKFIGMKKFICDDEYINKMAKVYIPFWPKFLLRKMCETLVIIVSEKTLKMEFNEQRIKVYTDKMLIDVLDENLKKSVIENIDNAKEIIKILREALEGIQHD